MGIPRLSDLLRDPRLRWLAAGWGAGALSLAGALWLPAAAAAAAFLGGVLARGAAVIVAARARRAADGAQDAPAPDEGLPREAIDEILRDDASPRRADLSRAIALMAVGYGLSPREREILVLLVRGRDVRHISEALVVSVNTVRTHVSNIYGKLGVHSRQELLDAVERFAREAGAERAEGRS